jgi:hypothetical protein
MLAYDYALTPLFAPSLRGGMPEEERNIVERTIPRSDALARRATTLDPKGADGFVALGYANLRPPDLIDFAMTPDRRLSAVRCRETAFRWR